MGYLDNTGLSYLWNKINKKISSIDSYDTSIVINSDGSISETLSDNSKITTSFSNSQIIEKITDSNNVVITRTTTINSDGSITTQ